MLYNCVLCKVYDVRDSPIISVHFYVLGLSELLCVVNLAVHLPDMVHLVCTLLLSYIQLLSYVHYVLIVFCSYTNVILESFCPKNAWLWLGSVLQTPYICEGQIEIRTILVTLQLSDYNYTLYSITVVSREGTLQSIGKRTSCK